MNAKNIITTCVICFFAGAILAGVAGFAINAGSNRRNAEQLAYQLAKYSANSAELSGAKTKLAESDRKLDEATRSYGIAREERNASIQGIDKAIRGLSDASIILSKESGDIVGQLRVSIEIVTKVQNSLRQLRNIK
jgi:hypothetical protein